MTIDLDLQEASDVLIAAQTRALEDYRNETEQLTKHLAIARGDLAAAWSERDGLGYRLSEVEGMNIDLTKRYDELHCNACRYLDEVVDLFGVLRDILSEHRVPIGALSYFDAILRHYREKFHPSIDDASDIPF